MSQFRSFGLSSPILKALNTLQFHTPTPIQEKTLQTSLEGKDIIGVAQTGSGKTAAFSIPLIEHLLKVRQKTALILAPTRELAVQIDQTLKQLYQNCPQFKSAVLIGGESMGRQLKQLRSRPRPQIWVATPGRLLDLENRNAVQLRYVDFLVLDEADRMLDMGFEPQLKEIARKLPAKEKRQTLMFSATMAKDVEELSKNYLNSPEIIKIANTSGESSHVSQSFVELSMKQKNDRLLDELNERPGQVIVFTGSKHRTDRLTKFLKSYRHKVSLIHGDRSQGQRQRALDLFRKGESRILVATDIAARGLDVPKISTVINFDLPRAPEDYIHRIGRTARAGEDGEAITFLTPGDRMAWRKIRLKCKLKSQEGYKKDSQEKTRDRKERSGKRPSSKQQRKPRRDEKERRFDRTQKSVRSREESKSEGSRKSFQVQRKPRRDEKERRFDRTQKSVRSREGSKSEGSKKTFRDRGAKKKFSKKRTEKGKKPSSQRNFSGLGRVKRKKNRSNQGQRFSA